MDQLATEKLIAAIEKLGDGITTIASQRYTLTGAADWPILLFMAGIIMAMVGYSWRDLKSTIKEQRNEWRQELKAAEDQIWDEMRRHVDQYHK